MRIRAFVLCAGVLMSSAHASQCSQTALVTGFPPGGPADTVARYFADAIKTRKSGVHVEHRPGVVGLLAANHVRSAEPDGCTLYVMSSASIMKIPPDFGLVPVGRIATYDFVLVGNRDTPRTLDAYLKLAASEDEWRNYATPGAGSIPHLIVRALSATAQIPLVHVAMKGSAPAIQAVISRQQIYMAGTVAGGVLSHVQSGDLHVLATTGARRSRIFPDAPTLREIGYDITVDGWMAMYAPPATPKSVVDAWHRLLSGAVFAQGLRDAGYDPAPSSPEELGVLHKQDYDLLSKYDIRPQ